jgi:transcriptional regulator with XRE-family HTH domain
VGCSAGTGLTVRRTSTCRLRRLRIVTSRSIVNRSLRELTRRVDLSPNFLSKMELGHFPPPGEQIIVLIAETLDQSKDEMLALAGKVSSDLIEIILQRPKEAGPVHP